MTGIRSAFLDVRFFPWRLRRRQVSGEDVRDAVSQIDPTSGIDDVAGVVVALAVWLAIIVAAPVLAILLAWGLFSIELPLLILIGAVVLLARFAGVIPWTVLVVDNVAHSEDRARTRSFLGALREIRAVNGTRQVPVRWSWM